MSYMNPTGPLSERQQRVLKMHDDGQNIAQIAEAEGMTEGAAGNSLREALRKSNRGGEIKAGGRRKVTGVGTDDVRNLAESTLKDLQDRLDNLGDPNAKPAAMVTEQTERLTASLERAQAALDAFTSMSEADRKQWVTDERERRTKQSAEQREQIEQAIAKTQATLDAIAQVEALASA